MLVGLTKLSIAKLQVTPNCTRPKFATPEIFSEMDMDLEAAEKLLDSRGSMDMDACAPHLASMFGCVCVNVWGVMPASTAGFSELPWGSDCFHKPFA